MRKTDAKTSKKLSILSIDPLRAVKPGLNILPRILVKPNKILKFSPKTSFTPTSLNYPCYGVGNDDFLTSTIGTT